MPSQAEIEQYQQDLDQVSALAVAEVAAVLVALSGEDDKTLISAIPAAMEPYMAAAADLAASWYRGLAREKPRKPQRQKGAPQPISGPTERIALLDAADFEPRPAELSPREQIEATVRWALYAPEPTRPNEPAAQAVTERQQVPRTAAPAAVQETATQTAAPEPAAQPTPATVAADRPQESAAPEEPPRARVVASAESEQQARVISRLSRAMQRYVTTAARDTIVQNAEREGVRWARHAKPDACAFCRLLATRGPDYLSKESAQFVGANGRTRGERKIGELYHDDCGCVPVPVRAGDDYEPPTYVARWTTQYSDAYDEGDGDFRSILSAMRQAEMERGGSRH